MKKKLLIGSLVVVVILLCIFYFVVLKNKKNKVVTEGVEVVPTMNDKIDSDSTWCGTFQLVWNDMINEVVRQDILFKDNNDMQLTELASLHREKTCAQYVLMSKVKSAGRIPSQFKMSKNRALSIVHRYLPREKFIQYFQMLYPRIYRVYKLLYCIKEKVFYKR